MHVKVDGLRLHSIIHKFEQSIIYDSHSNANIYDSHSNANVYGSNVNVLKSCLTVAYIRMTFA